MVKCKVYLFIVDQVVTDFIQAYTAINVWRGKSEVHWDNTDGCGIMPEIEKVWQEHLEGGVSTIFLCINFLIAFSIQ